MIVVTGAVGFIGSNLVHKLNTSGINDILLVDDFTSEIKNKNLANKNYSEKIHRDDFISWLENHHSKIEFIFHIGARTDTAEFNREIFKKLNLGYTQSLWKKCSLYSIPLLYASSAATYGAGEFGYNDDHKIVYKLCPLNPYGESKNDFDRWALEQDIVPPFWAGLKFFNVYGPNEYHKGRMASVIFHAYNQILKSGEMKLFRSHKPDFKDGEQKRDFIFIKDVVDVIYFMFRQRPESGLYNLGSGIARTFLDLTKNTFAAMGVEEKIYFINTPADIRDKYQYFTEANMKKIHTAGYLKEFTSLEAGVKDYVCNYLSKSVYA